MLFDQLKAVVLEDRRPLGGRVLENPEFLRFAAHWGFRIRACRPYRVQTKGKVERPIRYVRQSFLYGRAFAGDADLNAQALQWLATVANVRDHGTTHTQPVVRFERDEHAALQPLAARPYRRSSSCPRLRRLRRGPWSRADSGRAAALARLRRPGDGGLMKTAPSLRERLRTQLADLKMPGALEALDDILARIHGGHLKAPEALEALLGAQITLRNNRRLVAAMRSSRLPAVKTLADFDFAFQPSLQREQIDSLHTLGFVERKEKRHLPGPARCREDPL